MADPVATYGAQVIPKGFRIHGDVQSGIKATVPYLLDWGIAYEFAYAILQPVFSTTVGPITFTTPYRFPGVVTPIYAQRWSIEPVGTGGRYPTYGGLVEGEYFAKAIVTVEFEQMKSIQAVGEDPNGLNQLDPLNPLTLCEQSVQTSSKLQTRKGFNYRYDDDNSVPPHDIGVNVVDSKLVLKFPRVPFLPWQLVQPYIGAVNSDLMLGCQKGTMLLEGMSTDVKPNVSTLANQGQIVTGLSQQVTLNFGVAERDWNMRAKPDGSYVLVHTAADPTTPTRIYPYKDFRQIFNYIEYTAATS